jgi:hypothetical protein
MNPYKCCGNSATNIYILLSIKSIMTQQALSKTELKKALSGLQETFPSREIIQAYPLSYACNLWGKQPGETSKDLYRVGRNKFNGIPVDLEMEIEVFHSVNDWKCGPEPLTVETYLPNTYQVWVEKKFDQAWRVAMAFSGVGLKLGVSSLASCDLVPKDERKEYWASEHIWYPDVEISKIQTYREEGMIEGAHLFLHPGHYSSAQFERVFDNQPLENLVLMKLDADPALFGADCKMCGGEQYRGIPDVKFLAARSGSAPVLLSCEFCLDDYLAQISSAFKK